MLVPQLLNQLAAPYSLALLVLGAGVGPPLLEQVGHHVAVAPTRRHDQGGHALASKQGHRRPSTATSSITPSPLYVGRHRGWCVVGGTWLASLASTSSPRDTSTCTASSWMGGHDSTTTNQHQSEGLTRTAGSRGGPPSLPPSSSLLRLGSEAPPSSTITTPPPACLPYAPCHRPPC